MEHQHSHNHKNGLSLAFWLNLLFSIVEIIGGLLTNSTAIIADAFHDFMDAIAIGSAVLLEKLSGKKRTPTFSYGYKRFSLLSALGMSLFLLIGAVLMTISAVKSLFNPGEVNSLGMLWLAVLGIAINGFAFLRIKNGGGHQHAHAHSHAHGHSHNHNSKAIMLHLLEDVLGWAAVLVGAIVIYFTGWFWIDGALALAIALFIGYNATRNLISTMSVLLQSVPENVDVEQLTSELRQISGIENVHDLHVWSLDGSYHVGSLHAVVNASDQSFGDSIRAAIVQLLEKYNIQHATIQFETTNANCGLINC
jgi:cobalt-zinc-cadmium efflux system protein